MSDLERLDKAGLVDGNLVEVVRAVQVRAALADVADLADDPPRQFVLDRKIRHGPEEEKEEGPPVTTAEALVDAAGRLPRLTRHSMTLYDDETPAG